jgi:hypothetical protein
MLPFWVRKERILVMRLDVEWVVHNFLVGLELHPSMEG